VNVLIAGGTGFVGSALARFLTQRGHRVSLLSRRPSAPRAMSPVYHWDPEREELDPNALEGIEAVVNLAGENLAGVRWTPERKRRLVASRVGATAFLVLRLSDRSPTPRTLVNASAIGIFGDRGDEVLTEESVPGSGFLADLCRAWEEAALRAREAGARVVVARFGIVLDPAGGALKKLTPIFKLGLGGPLGSGRQWWSWVTLADVLQSIESALMRDELTGPVNVVAPAPVRNRDFARVLGRVLKRPAILPAPEPVLRLALGEAADALLSSTCVTPRKLLSAGYRFAFEDLDRALASALRR
jgi:uncharacterized protein (TIGR01777 family)